MVLYKGSGKTKNKKYKKKNNTRKNQKTKYLPHELGGLYPVISYEKYQLFNKIIYIKKPESKDKFQRRSRYLYSNRYLSLLFLSHHFHFLHKKYQTNILYILLGLK